MDRFVIDCVLADNTGPLLATFWDDAAKEIQQLIAVHGVGFVLSIQGFKIMPLREDGWNGRVCTRINVLQSLPRLRGQVATFLKCVTKEEAFTPNMTTAIYRMPTQSTVIEHFTTARNFVTVPFRATVKGFVMDRVEDYSVSQRGNPLRHFTLMDKQGAYISCTAFDRHVDDENLSNNNEVIIYFGSGRAGVRNASSELYLYNDAVVVKCSNDVPRVWKQLLIEFPKHEE